MDAQKNGLVGEILSIGDAQSGSSVGVTEKERIDMVLSLPNVIRDLEKVRVLHLLINRISDPKLRKQIEDSLDMILSSLVYILVASPPENSVHEEEQVTNDRIKIQKEISVIIGFISGIAKKGVSWAARDSKNNAKLTSPTRHKVITTEGADGVIRTELVNNDRKTG